MNLTFQDPILAYVSDPFVRGWGSSSVCQDAGFCPRVEEIQNQGPQTPMPYELKKGSRRLRTLCPRRPFLLIVLVTVADDKHPRSQLLPSCSLLPFLLSACLYATCKIKACVIIKQ